MKCGRLLLCDHHHHPSPVKPEALSPRDTNPPTPPCPQPTATAPLLCASGDLVQGDHIVSGFFGDWFLPLGILSSCFIHVVAYVRTSFFRLKNIPSCGWATYRSSIDGPLSCFCLLATVKLDVQIPLWDPWFRSFGVHT